MSQPREKTKPMCGITGIVNLDKRPAEKAVLKDMAEALRHRGPDDAGLYTSGAAGLGHVRLSIIDLSKDASQPMANADSTAVIVHNGEIYNYLELMDELKALGYDFRSKSDTEVILHAYDRWGEGCLKRFNGMWSFAILDLKKRVLFCARDRFGVKPFYYYMDRDRFVFASEIKAFLRHPAFVRKANDRAIFGYLASGYGYMDTNDETFFEGVKQLRPAHYATLPLDGGVFSQKRYWDLDPRNRARADDEDEVLGKFYALFEDSVRLRLRSDVPVGVSLSGGLDSSSVACAASGLLKGNAIEAFSSCFDEAEFDERRYIAPVLEKTQARANYIFTRPERLFDEIGDIIWHQDEPYSTLSIFPQWYVMKLAREKGVKVLLTGQGGDEVLGGYHKYYYYLFADLVYSGRWGRARREMETFGALKGPGAPVASNVAKILASHIAPQAVKDALAGPAAMRNVPAYLDRDFAKRNACRAPTAMAFASILNNDLYNALRISPLPSLLHIDDRSSMAHSVESRAPLLDYRLVEYAFSLGPGFKIRDGVTKYLLRSSMKGILPEEVRARTDKMGFATPLERWFRTVLRRKVSDIVGSESFRKRPYFDREGARLKLEEFLGGKGEGGHFTIWSWVNLELWLRRFIDAG